MNRVDTALLLWFDRMTIWNLYMAPRISEPVWLTMVSQGAERSALCQRFLKEMSLLMDNSGKTQSVHFSFHI